MIDALTGSMTVFDLLVIVVVLLSALIGLARGFLRELATIAAIFFASIAAYFGRLYFRESVDNMLPDTTPAYYADCIIIALAFIVTYLIVRTLGGQLSKLVQGTGDITIVDRLAGLFFGVARGMAVPFLLAWLILNIAPANAVPDIIAKSATYPFFERAAGAIDVNAADIVDQVDEYIETPDEPVSDE